MAQLFGSVEALNAMLVLTGESGSVDMIDALESMNEAAGATEKAFDIMDKGVSDSFGDMLVNAQNLGIELGDKLAPHLENLIEDADWDLQFGFLEK